MSLNRIDIPDHIMDIEGWDQTHLHGLPSPFTLDVRGHQGPTMGLHMQITANQGSKVEANQHPPSPMSVVEPAQAGGPTFLPGVNVPPQVGFISHVGVHGPLQNVYEQYALPSMHSNRTNVLHVNPYMSNAANQNTSRLAASNTGHIVVPFGYGVSGFPIVSTHVPNTAIRDNGRTNGIAAANFGVKRLTSSESKTEEIQAPKKKKQKTATKQKYICKWCGSEYKSGLPRHMKVCEDGLFEAACYAIHAMFGNSKTKIKNDDVKKAYCEVIKSTERKAELISRIKERMTNRTKSKITQLVRAPRGNGSGYKAFQGLDAMVCLFFRLFGLQMPLAAGLDSYNFTGFDADISAEVKKFILRWILMTRKTAGRDGLNAIGYTSQDSLSNDGDCKVVLDMSPEDWNALEKEEFSFLHDKSDDLKKLGSMVKHFELRLFNLAPKEKFKWLRCFLVTLRGFSVEALELKTLPNGEVKYRNLESDEGKGVLASMSTFVMQNYDKLVKSFRDVVASQDHATELRLQLLRAILAMPSDRRASHLITLADKLVGRLSEDVPGRFSSQFGDVSLITYPWRLSSSETLSIAESAQTDLCHFVHVQGSRSSRMRLVNSKKGILQPISEDQDNLHSTALDLFINRGLNSKAVLSLPDFINSQTLRITSDEQWKAMSLETKSASEFAKLDALFITKCAISMLEIGMFLKRFRDLRCLRLVDNDISTLQPGVFDHLSRLEILDLSWNRIASIPSDVFNACKSLREVCLGNNKIRTLSPRAFEGLSNLKILRLEYNKIQSLAKDVFHGLESLETLDLYGNKLQRLPVGLFQTLRSLTKLHLSYNQLQSLDKGTFNNLRSLRELNLSNNQLQSLDKGTFDDLKSLEELNLWSNKLQRLPLGLFQTLRSLTKLDLSFNQLQRLDKGTFKNLRSLRELRLYNNQLQSLDKGTFDDLRSLEILRLSSNKLQRLPVGLFQTLRSLRVLRLHNNQLQSLDKGTFNNLRSLRRLYLYNNELQSLDKGAFADLKSLEHLDLEDNSLNYTQIDPTTFDSLNGVRILPDLPSIRNRMRETPEERKKRLESLIVSGDFLSSLSFNIDDDSEDVDSDESDEMDRDELDEPDPDKVVEMDT